jgi:hypothetical protein
MFLFDDLFFPINPTHRFFFWRGGGSQSCGGIQENFMGAEIPGFDLPNRFSGLITSQFSRDGNGKLIFYKVK